MSPVVFLSSSLIFAGTGIFLFSQAFPFDKYFKKASFLQQRRVERFSSQLEDIFYIPSSKLISLLAVFPLFVGIIVFILTKMVFAAAIGAAVGFIVPSFFLRMLKRKRIERFNEQLVDGLMDISNSLKGGLSFVQAIESMVSTSIPPLKDEFGLVLRAHKMGASLAESLQMLNKRVNSEYLRLMTTAIVIGQETGGNLVRVFSRLIMTIRERKKVNDRMKLMTFQGKMQASIISILPAVFIVTVHKMDPSHFEVMLQSELGRKLLIIAVILQVTAWALIAIFTKVRY